MNNAQFRRKCAKCVSFAKPLADRQDIAAVAAADTRRGPPAVAAEGTDTLERPAGSGLAPATAQAAEGLVTAQPEVAGLVASEVADSRLKPAEADLDTMALPPAAARKLPALPAAVAALAQVDRALEPAADQQEH